MARKFVSTAHHVYGNVFMGDSNAAYLVRTWNNGATGRLFELRHKLAMRVIDLANAGREEEAVRLERFLYTTRHAAPYPKD